MLLFLSDFARIDIHNGYLTMADRRSDFRLGDWLVSPMLNRISKGDESFNLKHKAMAVLVRLADANGEVVTRAKHSLTTRSIPISSRLFHELVSGLWQM